MRQVTQPALYGAGRRHVFALYFICGNVWFHRYIFNQCSEMVWC